MDTIKGMLAGAMLWIAVGIPVAAHEFWIMPATFELKKDTPVELNLFVGQFFDGELVPLSLEYVTVVLHYSTLGKMNITSRVPRSSKSGMQIPFASGGTHLLAIDTHPNRVELSADKFNYYLHDEGLDSIIAMRDAAGKSAMPSRERYRRHIKTLLSVDGKSDDTVLMRTGQRLEIIPLADPFRRQAGDSLDFRLMFDDKPLVNALLKAWHKQDGQTMLIRVRSNHDGIVHVTLPFAGSWMLSTVHMLPVSGDPGFDWESFWGNLTFQLGKSGKP